MTLNFTILCIEVKEKAVFLDLEEAEFDDVNYWDRVNSMQENLRIKRKTLLTRSKADDKAKLRVVLKQLKI